jgi:hypothetical protein
MGIREFLAGAAIAAVPIVLSGAPAAAYYRELSPTP